MAVFGYLSQLLKLEQKILFGSNRILPMTHRTKGEPWNSLMKAAAPTYRQVPKTTESQPPRPI